MSYLFYEGEDSRRDFRVTGFNIFFFFQAEDGIRVYKVTGVQTCALRILVVGVVVVGVVVVGVVVVGVVVVGSFAVFGQNEIGRAACRERV